MTTYARSTTPLTAVRARSQSWAMAWQDDAGTANSLVGCTVTARMSWRLGATVFDAAVTITNAAGGLFTVDPTALQLTDLPEGQVSDLSIEIVDTQSASHVYEIPVVGKVR